MSTIAVDNIKPSAGGTAFTMEGVAKALLNYNQATPAVVDSLNVGSVTDNGTGDFTVNFTNAFSDGNYTVCGTASINSGAGFASNRIFGIYGAAGGAAASMPTTTACRVATIYGTETKQDTQVCTSSYVGDLA